MGSIVIVTALFMGLGLSFSWVAGHKEKVELSEKLTEKTVAEKKLQTDIKMMQAEAERTNAALKEAEEKLALEAEERKKAEEARLLTEQRLQLAEDEKKKIEERCGESK